MKLILTFLLVALLALEGFVEGEKEKTCQEKETESNKRKFDSIAVCTKEMNFKTGREKALKMTCVLVCVLKKEGMLQSDGRITMEGLEIGLKTLTPKGAAKLRPQLQKCVDIAGDASDANVDELCKSYEPFIKCAMQTKTITCKEENETT